MKYTIILKCQYQTENMDIFKKLTLWKFIQFIVYIFITCVFQTVKTIQTSSINCQYQAVCDFYIVGA